MCASLASLVLICPHSCELSDICDESVWVEFEEYALHYNSACRTNDESPDWCLFVSYEFLCKFLQFLQRRLVELNKRRQQLKDPSLSLCIRATPHHVLTSSRPRASLRKFFSKLFSTPPPRWQCHLGQALRLSNPPKMVLRLIWNSRSKPLLWSTREVPTWPQ